MKGMRANIRWLMPEVTWRPKARRSPLAKLSLISVNIATVMGTASTA